MSLSSSISGSPWGLFAVHITFMHAGSDYASYCRYCKVRQWIHFGVCKQSDQPARVPHKKWHVYGCKGSAKVSHASFHQAQAPGCQRFSWSHQHLCCVHVSLICDVTVMLISILEPVCSFILSYWTRWTFSSQREQPCSLTQASPD